ncbi:MAG: DUF6485 family protein [Eubacteriales bacterium]
MSCEHSTIKIDCSCTYSCAHHGKCCECVAYHRRSGEFPACFFSKEAEKTYDRSFERLKRDREKRR